MSSDEEEEFLTGRQKRSASLAKRGRNRISTLADDDDGDDGAGMFENDEEDDSEDDSQKYRPVDVSFSASNLKKALQKLKLKGCIMPEPDDDFEPKNWKEMEKEIRTKGIVLQELETLIKYLNRADNISLEYKCLVISIARQTCIGAKLKEDTKKAQELFKSKEKGNKSNHVANFVSNTWFWDSMQHLQKIGALSGNNSKNNMHIIVIECSLQFMRDSYVIDSEKKMNVLKERQQIDWAKALQRATKLASANKLVTMSAEAALTEKHFDTFKEGNKPSDPAAGGKDPLSTSAASESTSSVQELAKKKRTERLQNLRRRVSATSLQNSTSVPPASSSSTSIQPSSTLKSPPLPHPVNQRRGSDSPSKTNSHQELHLSTNNQPRNDMNDTGARSSSWGESRPVELDSSPTPWGQSSSQIRSPTSNVKDDASHPPAPAPAPAGWGGTPESPPLPPPAKRPESEQSLSWGAQPSRDSAVDHRPPSSSWGAAPPRDSANDRGPSSSYGAPPPRDDSVDNSRSSSSWGAPPPRDSGNRDTRPSSAWGAPPSHDSAIDSRPSETHDRGSSWDTPDVSLGTERRPLDTKRRSSATEDGSYSRAPVQSYSQQQDVDRNYPRDSYSSSSVRSDRLQTISTSVVGDSGSADARGRGWGSSSPGSTTYSAGSAHDNQTGGGSFGYDQPRDYGGGSSGDYSSNRDSYSQGRNLNNRPSRDYDLENRQRREYDVDRNPRDLGMDRRRSRDVDMDRRSERNGDKRPRYEKDPPPHNQDPFPDTGAATGRGRGRGRTLPAWMTSDSGGGSNPSLEHPPRPQQSIDEYGREPPRDRQPPERNFPPQREDVALQGNGRGRGRTLPAWMTNTGPQGQPSGPPPNAIAPPEKSRVLPPPRRGGFPESSELQGTGRGRGRTLPAWMTQQK